MKEQSLETLFLGELKDIFNAEQQLTKAIPKAMKAAQSEQLSQALEKHLAETHGQIERLKEIFRLMEIALKGKPCKAMSGLIEECSELMEEYDKSDVRDMGIITKCQRIEHYEMATYSSILFAKELDIDRAVTLLQETLHEEIQADKKLGSLAKGNLSKATKL